MGWGDKFNQLTKTAVSKSKEVAEITRLNMEISSSEQKMKELAAQIGMIVAAQGMRQNRRFFVPYLLALAGLTAAFYVMSALCADPGVMTMRGFAYVMVMMQIGMIVAGQSLLSDHEEIAGLAEQVRALQEAVARNQSLIQEIRNINICAQCGAEVSRTSKFCDKCGSPMDRSALESADAAPVCPACGEPLEPDALFCTNCGAKVSP